MQEFDKYHFSQAIKTKVNSSKLFSPENRKCSIIIYNVNLSQFCLHYSLCMSYNHSKADHSVNHICSISIYKYTSIIITTLNPFEKLILRYICPFYLWIKSLHFFTWRIPFLWQLRCLVDILKLRPRWCKSWAIFPVINNVIHIHAMCILHNLAGN